MFPPVGKEWGSVATFAQRELPEPELYKGEEDLHTGEG